MSAYLGSIAIRNRYVNFKPLYEYKNEKFSFISQFDRQALLPESQYGDINFYCDDGMRADEMFVDGEYRILDFEPEDLEDNYSNYGIRNQTGYKIEISKIDPGRIRTLADVNRFYLLDEIDGYEGSYRTNPTLIVKDPYAYEGLQVVIPVIGNPNALIGPFTVEWRESDSNLIIKTGLQNQKYVLWGYQFPSPLINYTFDVGRFGESRKFVFLDYQTCEKKAIDVITKEQLLTAFRDTLDRETFIDGKLDLSDIGDLISSHADSLFVGDGIPEDIQDSRFDAISTLLTDEEHLNDTFGFISETITGLLDKYQGNEQYSLLVQKLADDKDFMSKIQRFEIITERINQKQQELDGLQEQIDAAQQQISDAKKQDYASDLLGDYEEQINQRRDVLAGIEADISDKAEKLGIIETGRELQQKLSDLEAQVSYKAQRERELETSLQTLSSKLDSVFEASTEKAISFAFDGMLASRMLQQAADWESQQQKTDYGKKVIDLKAITLSMQTNESLIDEMISRVQKYRPNYDKNTILNIFICFSQGFLTVFSGEPGTGKTSICKILANALGLTVPSKNIQEYPDGFNPDRFISVSVERGWTTKRDFIGYYNPLTKTFDRTNRRIFDALNILDIEAKGQSTDMPFMILLDEANLSPMEYYWADYMNVCDDLDSTCSINLGDSFSYRVPGHLRFVATINNDHTTESLSPRLIDRAWVIRLPKVKASYSIPAVISPEEDEVISWSSLVATFGSEGEDFVQMSGSAKDIYDELINKCRIAKIGVSPRVDAAIRKYWSAAQKHFENDSNYGTDASIVALDYAVSQRILPHINGSGDKYGERLKDLQKFCSEKNLTMSADALAEIIQSGDETMKYYQFFA